LSSDKFNLDAEALYATLKSQVQSHMSAMQSIVGITSGGAWLAERLHAELAIQTPLGIISSALHRDDFNTKGVASSTRTSLPFAVDGADILLIDDVLHTGRTIRAVINELYDFCRPARVRLAVLVDRGERELPIAADFCAATAQLAAGQSLSLTREKDRFAFVIKER
jgi:pyrimidine operon attenuation protein / uracil phosphoribosyltransferase